MGRVPVRTEYQQVRRRGTLRRGWRMCFGSAEGSRFVEEAHLWIFESRGAELYQNAVNLQSRSTCPPDRVYALRAPHQVQNSALVASWILEFR